MRTIGSVTTRDWSSKPGIHQPKKCPSCGATATRSRGTEGDDFAIDVTFKCGAKVQWRSCSMAGGDVQESSSSITVIRECKTALPAVLAKAMAAHPDLRMGQLVWTAAFLARKHARTRCREGDAADVFYIKDEALAEGLDMVAREKSLPGDDASQLADRIRSYLTRKTGASLDGETVGHIAKLIRDVAGGE